MSEKAIHEAGMHFILNFTIKQGKYSVMVIGRGLFLRLIGEIHMRQGGDLYFISKIPCEA